MSQNTIRLTMAQALVRYLQAQSTRIDGKQVPLFAGVWVIFGHGNVAGLGEALYAARDNLPTYRAHNEQAMAQLRAPIYEERVVDHISKLIKINDKTVSREELFADDDDA